MLNLPPPLVEGLVVGGERGGGGCLQRRRRRRRGRWARQERLGGPQLGARPAKLQLEDDGDDPVVVLLPAIWEMKVDGE